MSARTTTTARRRFLHDFLVWAIVALMPLLMGYTCGVAAGGAPRPAGPYAWIYFDFEPWAVHAGEPMQVRVIVNTEYEFHSFDVDVKGSPQHVLLLSGLPSEPFDDNGILFVKPKYNISTGELRGLVDFRHGGPSATGTVQIAEFTMHPHASTASTLLEFTNVRLADASGEELTIIQKDQTFQIH